MSCYSNLSYSGNAEFKNIDELNQKIKIIDDGHSGFTVNEDGEIECGDDGYYGKFYEGRKFAELLSNYITSGNLEIRYSDEDGISGYKVSAGIVRELHCIMLYEDEIESYKKFKDYKNGSLSDLNDVFEELFIPQWYNKSNFKDILDIDIELTNEQFKKIKDKLIINSMDYLIDSITVDVQTELQEIQSDFPELFK
jgi:hypothetical protein